MDLADVVKQRDAFDGAAVGRTQSDGVGDDQREVGDAADVPARIRVVGVDGVEERFESRSSESLERSARAPVVGCRHTTVSEVQNWEAASHDGRGSQEVGY